MNTRNTPTKLIAVAMALVVLALSEEAIADSKLKAPRKVIVVNCHEGQTISKALRKAAPGDTILVNGTCHEKLTITKDRIALDGQGNAILDGGHGTGTDFDGLVIIDGASGVTVTGFTVQNGASGIVGRRGASFAVHNTTVQDNTVTGIVVADGSTADLTDCTMQRNRLGLDVVTGSSAILKGDINITHNAGNGVDVNGGSVLEVRGATVQASNNGAFGLAVGSGQLATFNFPESQGSTIIASHNGGGGILLADSTFVIFGNPTTVTAMNNPVGFFVPGNGHISSPLGRGKFLIQNNGIGMNFGDGSGAVFIGGLTVQNNGTGVLADAAGTLTFVSIPPNPSSITGNTITDVDLRFGTRATFGGVTIGTIKCDGTVLSRGGPTVCP